MKWDLEQIARLTGGTARGSAVVAAVSTHSRDIPAGSMFVAIRGECLDGHAFVSEAVSRGAVACLVERGALPDGVAGVEVADTLVALADLAEARRALLSVPVVAVTGSSGKTTTKDMIAAALGPGSHAAPESYNNEVGVPLTILGAPDDATAVVVEIGSRGVGHIAALARVIRPDVAVITNIGPAHLEMFGDLETVTRAKWELVDALEPGGIAVLPGEGPRVQGREAREVTFGDSAGADVAVSALTVDEQGCPSFTLTHDGVSTGVVLPFPGRHQAINAAAAVAASVALGGDLVEAARRVAGARLSKWRMEVTQVPMAGGSVTVINDAYNANPDSMTAALRTVSDMPGRHIAVLGRMHELGAAESTFHVEIGALAADLGYAAVIVVGEDPGIAEAAGSIAVGVTDADAAAARVVEMLEPGDVVLVKASRATGLEAVAEALVSGATA